MTTLWSTTTYQMSETAASRVCKFCTGGLHTVPEIYAGMCETCWGEEINYGRKAEREVRESPLHNLKAPALHDLEKHADSEP